MTRLKTRSIKNLYQYALVEGEGVGTAYEYYTKRLVLASWLPALPSRPTLRIFGLPEQYGVSLDFWLLAEELGATLHVVDDRPAALELAETAWLQARKLGLLSQLRPELELVAGWERKWSTVDLTLSSEVLQRISPDTQGGFLTGLLESSRLTALFCPNADNRAHRELSGLGGISLSSLRVMLDGQGAKYVAGFVDMPPFPPGITRTETQRKQATTGVMESFAMQMLSFYARGEKLLPSLIRRRQSHIVYALVGA